MAYKESLNEIRGIIQERMDAYLQENSLNLKTASSIYTGKAFTEFYIRDIAHYTYGITDDDFINNGLRCDGSNDKGFDFIYETDDNEFWICQSKFKGRSSSLGKEEISDFFQLHSRIFDPVTRQDANSAVRDLLPPIKSKPNITFVLLTNTTATESNMTEFARMRKEATQSVKNGGTYRWELIDISKIKSQYKQVQSGQAAAPSVTIPVISAKGPPRYIDLSKEIARIDKNYKTIVTIIRGTTLRNLCEEHKDALFNSNIRGFLGRKGANKEIINTLTNEPEYFYLYNNGISAICTDMSLPQDEMHMSIHCKDFQIINGAQTVCSIRDFSEEYKKSGKLQKADSNLEKVLVLLRITQAEKTKSEKGLNKKIIISNNTQNIIRDADFHSNDPVQQSIKQVFEKENFMYKVGKPPYKSLVYQPKRIDPSKSKNSAVVKIDDLTKSLYAFDHAFSESPPPELYPQARILFNTDTNQQGVYWKIFGQDNQEVDMVTKQTATKFAAIAVLNMHLSKQLKQEVKDHDADTIDGMTFRTGRHFLRLFGYAIRTFYTPEEQDKIYRKIVDGAAFKSGGFIPVWYKYVKKSIHATLRHDSKKEFNFKTWLRNIENIKSLIDEIKYMVNEEGKPEA